MHGESREGKFVRGEVLQGREEEGLEIAGSRFVLRIQSNQNLSEVKMGVARSNPGWDLYPGIWTWRGCLDNVSVNGCNQWVGTLRPQLLWTLSREY